MQTNSRAKRAESHPGLSESRATCCQCNCMWQKGLRQPNKALRTTTESTVNFKYLFGLSIYFCPLPQQRVSLPNAFLLFLVSSPFPKTSLEPLMTSKSSPQPTTWNTLTITLQHGLTLPYLRKKPRKMRKERKENQEVADVGSSLTG